MRKTIYISQDILFIAILCVIVAGCGRSPSTSSSNPTYPADISGHVVIPQYLYVRDVTMWKNEGETDVFWVVEISIKNISYERPFTHDYDDYKNWQIVAGNETYPLGEGLMRALRYKEIPEQDNWSIPVGQSGNITVCFSVPGTLKVSDAKLCYQGQEPYFYGKLTGGDMVEVYDWNSRNVAQLSVLGIGTD
jgi:hypothetical protein